MIPQKRAPVEEYQIGELQVKSFFFAEDLKAESGKLFVFEVYQKDKLTRTIEVEYHDLPGMGPGLERQFFLEETSARGHATYEGFEGSRVTYEEVKTKVNEILQEPPIDWEKLLREAKGKSA